MPLAAATRSGRAGPTIFTVLRGLQVPGALLNHKATSALEAINHVTHAKARDAPTDARRASLPFYRFEELIAG